MNPEPQQPRDPPLCEQCQYPIGGLPVSPGGMVRCPECGRKAVVGATIVRPLRAGRWVLLGAGIGLAPMLAILISFVGRWFGASAWSDPATWYFLVSPAVVIGPLLIVTAFAVAHAKGRRRSRCALLGISVFLVGMLVGGIAWVTSLLYFASTYSVA